MKKNKQILAAALAAAALLGGMNIQAVQAAEPTTAGLAAQKFDFVNKDGKFQADFTLQDLKVASEAAQNAGMIGIDKYGQAYVQTSAAGNAVALGTKANANVAGSVAIGAFSKATGSANFATAIGYGAQALHNESVALGYGSVAKNDGSVSVGHKKGDIDIYGKAYANDYFRKVTNVADGTFAKNSHDAVTAGQLYAAGIVPGKIEAKPGDTAKNSIAIGEKSKVTGNNSIAIGGQALSSADVVLGQDAVASGVNATAIGNNSHANAAQSTALGQNAWATAAGSVALGNNSVANEANTVSVGKAGGERRIVNVAAGTKDTDAVNFKQLSDVDAKAQANTDVLAAYKAAGVVAGTNNGQYNVVLGDSSFVNGQNSVAIGRRADVEANFGTAIGDNAQVYGINSVAIGSDSVASENNVVSVGTKDQTRKVVNVADGVNANDAVNKAQLDQVDTKVEGLDKLAVKYDSDAKDTVTFGGANGTALKNVSEINGEGDAFHIDQYGHGRFNDIMITEGNATMGPNSNNVKVLLDDQHSYLNGVAFVDGSILGTTAITNPDTGKEEGRKLNGNRIQLDGDSIYISADNNTSGLTISAGQSAVRGDFNVTGTLTTEKGLTVDDGGIDSSYYGYTYGEDGNTVVERNQSFLKQDGDGVSFSYKHVNANTPDGDVTDVDNTFTFGKDGVKLSGKDGAALKITGVAAGEVSETSTDAVNGSQLNNVQNQVTNLDQNAVKWDEGTKDTIKGVQFAGNGALNAANGKFNVAADGTLYDEVGGSKLNIKATSAGLSSGNASLALTNNEAVLAAGGRNVQVGLEGVKFTARSAQQGDTNYTLIDGGKIMTNKVTGLANGEVSANSTDAVNGSQLNEVKSQVSTLDKDAVKWDKDAQGNTTNKINGVGLENGKVTAENGISAGNGKFTVDEAGNVTTGNLNVNGSFKLNGKEIATSGDIADLSGAMGLVDGKVSLTNGGTSLSDGINKNTEAISQQKTLVSGEDGKFELTNGGTTVEAGINKNTEAISQQKTLVSGEDGKFELTNGATTVEAGINQNTVDILQNRDAINSLGRSVNKLGGEIDSVGAISAALAGLHPIDYDPADSKYQLSAALGSYDGSSALAMGGFYNFNEDVLLSLGVSTALKGERKTAGNLGVTFRIGAGAEKKAVPEADKDILTRIAELAQKVSVLEQKNDKLEKENADQKKQIEVLQAKTF